MRKILGTLLIGLLLTVSGDIVRAGPYEDGVAAHERGDYTAALRVFLPLAERGYAKAQVNVGIMYAYGEGVARDHRQAVKWYRLAAQQNDPDALVNLGIMYNQGQGVARDYKEAAKWYRLAAQQGNAVAQYNLGVMYGRGKASRKTTTKQ